MKEGKGFSRRRFLTTTFSSGAALTAGTYGGGLSRKTLEICQWLDIP